LFYEPESIVLAVPRDENGTEIFRIDCFRFLYYEPFFNINSSALFHGDREFHGDETLLHCFQNIDALVTGP
jgi:hypothetical protein